MKRRALLVEKPGRLEGLLFEQLGVSRPEVKALLARGAVYLDGRRCTDGSARVGPGSKVMAVLEEAGVPVTAHATSAPRLVVLLEDENVIAVDKPAGVTAQPTPGRVGDSLVDLVSAQLRFPAGLVHRLDRETSGVTVFGKTREATSALAAAFREGTAKKEYVAVVASGVPAQGRIELPLSRDASRPGRWRASTSHNGLPAVTRFERLSDDGKVAVVRLLPQTGRTHQLRAHLAGIGFPIIGDRLYGGSDGPRCLLHARRLEVLDYVLEAPLPGDLARFVAT